MRRKFKKYLALALTLALVVTMAIPASVSASNYSYDQEDNITEVGSGSYDSEIRVRLGLYGQAEFLEEITAPKVYDSTGSNPVSNASVSLYWIKTSSADGLDVYVKGNFPEPGTYRVVGAYGFKYKSSGKSHKVYYSVRFGVNKAEVSSVSVGGTKELKVGEAIGNNFFSIDNATANCADIYSQTWNKEDGTISSAYVIKKGEKYRGELVLKPKEKYAFSSLTGVKLFGTLSTIGRSSSSVDSNGRLHIITNWITPKESSTPVDPGTVSVIKDVNVTVTPPSVGAKSATTFAASNNTNGTTLSQKELYWEYYDNGSWRTISSGAAFEAGKKYRVTMTILPSEGYFAGGDTASSSAPYTGNAVLNGVKLTQGSGTTLTAYANLSTSRSRCLTIVHEFPQLGEDPGIVTPVDPDSPIINNIDIRINAPTAGAAIKEGTSGWSVTNKTNYATISNLDSSWDEWNDSSKSWVAAKSPFTAGKKYRVNLIFKASEGYFAGGKGAAKSAPYTGTVTINGQAVDSSNLTASAYGDNTNFSHGLEMYYIFPTVSNNPVDPVNPPTPVDPSYVFPFVDVPSNAWYYKDVMNANKLGLIDGKTPTEFKANDNMTYAEAIKLAACMNQLSREGEVTLKNGSPWYKTYVDYAKAHGIPADYDGMNEKISRMDYVHIFYHALPESSYTKINNVSAVPDLYFKGTIAKEILAFYNAGILTGNDSKGNFAPDSNIKRSEVAAILSRMMDNSARKTFSI